MTKCLNISSKLKNSSFLEGRNMINLAQIIKFKKIEGNISELVDVSEVRHVPATNVTVPIGDKNYNFDVSEKTPSLEVGDYITAYCKRRISHLWRRDSPVSYGLTDNYQVIHH
jgi:hypothetical protein